MEWIEADVDGLSALGKVCKREAENLAVERATPHAGPRFQVTTTAVDDVMRMAARAENLISMRLRVTGHTVVKAAHRLSHCESTSRDRITVAAV